VILNADHPEIVEVFIQQSRSEEERKPPWAP